MSRVGLRGDYAGFLFFVCDSRVLTTFVRAKVHILPLRLITDVDDQTLWHQFNQCRLGKSVCTVFSTCLSPRNFIAKVPHVFWRGIEWACVSRPAHDEVDRIRYRGFVQYAPN